MTSYYWKVKALASTEEILNGKEVKIKVKDTHDVPSGHQIKEAFKAQHNIDAPDEICSNKGRFVFVKQAPFFYDNSEGNPAELLIDYFMSWTIRCAVDPKPDNVSEKVHSSAKCILHFLLRKHLENESIDDFKVVDVETLKQWNKIDLLCSIQIRVGTVDTWYVLAFENKMYTKLHSDQLKGYKESVDKRYPDKENLVKVFIYLTMHAKVPPEDKKQCEPVYKPYPLCEIGKHLRKYHPATGNALFDEFWHNFF